MHIAVFVVSMCLAVGCLAQQDTLRYDKEEIMVPMRDGVRLFTRIFTPRGGAGKWPVLIMRSPYPDWNMGLVSPERDPYVANMAAEGYIFVYQNIRGKQKSEGRFIMEGPFSRRDTGINEASDGYDLVEFLLHHCNTNGRMGQLGISYPGEMALISGLKSHPALKAVSPQGTVGDFFLGDDYFHNGAFRLSFSFEYVYSEESGPDERVFPFTRYDLFQWYLDLGPLSNVNKKYFHNKIPTWNDFVAHPDYDDYWRSKSPVNYSDTPVIPILHVGGFWDQENAFGPQALYAKMEQFDTKNYNYLIMGPWKHGQWADKDASVVGQYEMHRNTGPEFRDFQKQWFDYWLKGLGPLPLKNATVYQTGSNLWQSYDTWPPPADHRLLYLHAGKTLDFGKKGTAGADTYISDPDNPVQYRSRPIEVTYSDSSNWEDWLTEDQRMVDHRPDVLSYTGDPLESDLTVTGNIVAHLFAATTGSDADWVVKLIDVYPDIDKTKPELSENELIVASEIFRARFKDGFSAPKAVVPNQVEEYTIDLHEANHVFKKGHRLMVQIQSTWFPLYDRNPQTFVPNIFEAKEGDFIKATQSIYRGGKYASYISLPVVN